VALAVARVALVAALVATEVPGQAIVLRALPLFIAAVALVTEASEGGPLPQLGPQTPELVAALVRLVVRVS
jgi:hypothetical protein